MGRITKFFVVCALAIAAIVASTTAAQASTGLRLASGTALTVTASGVATLNTAGTNIICNVNLLLRINSSITKTAGSAVVGNVIQTGSTISNCNGGYSGTVDDSINIVYGSFGGTLPTNITSVSGIAQSARFTMTGGTVFGTNRCQFTGNLTVSLVGPGTSFSSGRFNGSTTTGGGACPARGSVTSGTLALYANAALGTTLTSVAIVLF